MGHAWYSDFNLVCLLSIFDAILYEKKRSYGLGAGAGEGEGEGEGEVLGEGTGTGEGETDGDGEAEGEGEGEAGGLVLGEGGLGGFTALMIHRWAPLPSSRAYSRT